MAERGDFLSRWSRRKRLAEDRAEAEAAARGPAPRRPGQKAGPSIPAPAGAAGPDAAAPRDASPGGPHESPPGASPGASPGPPADLPDLETLGEGSDFRRFMREDVPAALRHAALRKAWATNPAITGHKPLVDYDWDFHAPGFGRLRPGDDPRKLLATLFKHNYPAALAEAEAAMTRGEEPAGALPDVDRPREASLAPDLDSEDAPAGAIPDAGRPQEASLPPDGDAEDAPEATRAHDAGPDAARDGTDVSAAPPARPGGSASS